MGSALVNTITDMEKLYYSNTGQHFLNPDDLMSPFITKDAQITSSTTGVYNAVYGAQAWVQLNMEANTFGILPKIPWQRSGWRVISARSATLPSAGVTEGGALLATVEPTFAEVTTKPKTAAVNFENSEVQEFLAASSGDDAYAAMADLRTYFAKEHREDINAMLNVANETLATYKIESIDRICGSYAEITNCKESDESTAYTAGDLDIFSLDRDSTATHADAYVSYNSTSGSLRSLTDTLLQTVLQNTLKNGASPEGQTWQTGYDTWAVINQIYDPQVRYNIIGQTQVQPGVNGIKAPSGHGVGFNVSTVFGKPVILSKDTVTDTGGISRTYLLDTSNPEGYDYPRLFFRVAKPTQYFEAGMNTGNPFSINKLGTEGMFRTVGELICTFFATQGKVRDLTS